MAAARRGLGKVTPKNRVSAFKIQNNPDLIGVYFNVYNTTDCVYFAIVDWDLWKWYKNHEKYPNGPREAMQEDGAEEFFKEYYKVMNEIKSSLPSGWETGDGGDWDGGSIEVRIPLSQLN